MEDLVKLLTEKHLTISSVESLTGGLFASEIVSVSGAAEVYLGSLVTYANSIKEDLLKIDKEIIDKHGVVSKEIAYLMSKQACKLIDSDIMISFTGNAGPNTLEDKPVGDIYTCIKYLDRYYDYHDSLSGSRQEIREAIIVLSKNRIIDIVKKKGEVNGKR